MQDELKNELRGILNTPAKQLTKEQRNLVQTLADQLGIAHDKSKRCGSCVHDLALQVYNAIEAAEPAPENDERRFILREGVDLIFGSIRVNAATMTDELAERILAQGFERKYFVKCE